MKKQQRRKCQEKTLILRLSQSFCRIEERLIVTYSIKYKPFMQHKRLFTLNKASRMIAAKNSKKIDLKVSDNVRKFIKTSTVNSKGKAITDSTNRYSLD